MIKIELCPANLVDYITEHLGRDAIEETSCFNQGNILFYDIILSDSCFIEYYEKFGLRIENFHQEIKQPIWIDSRRFGRVIIN